MEGDGQGIYGFKKRALLKRVGGRLKSLIVCPAFWICSVQIRGMIGLGTRADLRSCREWYRGVKSLYLLWGGHALGFSFSYI